MIPRPTKIQALILAAGKGTRMKSPLPKVLHKISGKPIIKYVVEALESAEMDHIGIVVSPENKESIRMALGQGVDYIIQQEQLGTGHAVLAASGWLKEFEGSLVIVVGDAPFITSEIINQLIEKQRQNANVASFLTVQIDPPPPWGRVIRDESGHILRLVEAKDATETEKKIKEVSSSHFCFDWIKLKTTLQQISNDNAQGEYYLPDVIGKMVSHGWNVETESIQDSLPSFGINTPQDLKFAEEQMALRQNGK